MTVKEITKVVEQRPDSVIGYFGILSLEEISEIRSRGFFLGQYNAEEYSPQLCGSGIHLYAISTKKIMSKNGIPNLDSTLYG